MDNLKKFEFEALDSSEMKEVQGGNLFDDLVKVIKSLEPIINPIVGIVT